MIDITKFDGHTAGPWWFDDASVDIICANGEVARLLVGAASSLCQHDANGYLIAAAPDLLAEVMRLRTEVAALNGGAS